jgi:hypothetical protein
MKSILAQALTLLMAVLFQPAAMSMDYWDILRPETGTPSPLWRAGAGPAFMGDSELDSAYGPGASLFFDYNYLRYDFGWYGLDLYGRCVMKLFQASRNNIDENDYFLQEHYLPIAGLDAGLRLKTCGNFFGRATSFYLSAAPRLVYGRTLYRQDEESFGKSKNIFSLGLVGGAGIEHAITGCAGIFIEGNYGYTPAGEGDRNIEGPALYIGATHITAVQ